MEVEHIKITKLKNYKKNARKNDGAVKYVVESIEKFGFNNPILVNKDMVVIAGHTRLKAAKKLGLQEVPVIILDNLTEEQAKAYRLADNKTTEFSLWDDDLLTEELIELSASWDMGAFGFDVLDIEIPTLFEDEEPEDKFDKFEGKQHHRMNTVKQYNLQHVDESRLAGRYEMPKLEPVDYIPKRLIGFNFMLNSKDYDSGIHFFIDDYQFERVWNRPELYIEKMRDFECILTPDFSLYMNMPIAMKIWNVYRSRMIGQMAQDWGLIVIPTIQYAGRDTFDFAFDGLPTNSTLATSTVGVKNHEESLAVWAAGMDEAIKRLSPKRLLVYGGEVDYDYGDIEIVYFENEVTERMKEFK